MRTITIKQPYASLIVEGIKDIENRTWNTKFRGRVLIHSSAKGACKRDDYHKLLTTRQWEYLGVVPCLNMLSSNYNYDNAAIIGSVEIVDCVINHPSIWADKTIGGCIPNIDTHIIYNWVLANPILFDNPIRNVKGRLSFWDYDLTICNTCEQPFSSSCVE